jgi:hypothetical protein
VAASLTIQVGSGRRSLQLSVLMRDAGGRYRSRY